MSEANASKGNSFCFAYIIQCADGSLYVGHTFNLRNRIKLHNSGCGALHTRIKGPVILVYSEKHINVLHAIQRELQIKKWSRAKKFALITGNTGLLRKLSQSRD